MRSDCGARRHDEEDCGYINASHLRSKDYEQPEWDYIAAQARILAACNTNGMEARMRMDHRASLQHQACIPVRLADSHFCYGVVIRGALSTAARLLHEGRVHENINIFPV